MATDRIPGAPAGANRRSPGLSRRALLLAAAGLAAMPRAAFPQSLPRRPPHAPRPSDVCFSSRFARPNAPAAAEAFGATRLDWCYSADPAFFAAMRAAGVRTIGGALNSSLPDDGVPDSESETYRVGRARNRQGDVVVPPTYRPGVAWGCINNPDYRAILLAAARRAMAAGADWFTFDGYGMNFSAVNFGACFCEHCRRIAAAERADLDRQMWAFQRRSTTRFYRQFRAELNRAAGRRVTLAWNHWPVRPAWPDDLVDFPMTEILPRDAEPQTLVPRLLAQEAAGRPVTLTLVSREVALNRRLAALCYAHGANMLVPWDVEQAGQGRFFGRPADFAPIFRFARRLGPLLDDAGPAAPPSADAWSTDLPSAVTALRAAPDGRVAAFHLVAWRVEHAFRLSFDAARFLPGGRTIGAARLLAPGGVEIALQREGGRWACQAPALTWAVVELRPAA